MKNYSNILGQRTNCEKSEIGVDIWAKEMQTKVAAGYCSLDERLK